ncbi:MAG: mechanosensitive ion channel family protein [Candidatus Nezhaarchaeota archaeon]|nr:mechanosensitive ion channel family protein [Candidatus Nezhaarchaeota archaeon]MCX8142180.1 mechanosensitive ion channel family protein [Candidatus Nezhaarchaeota archaeon]MDW8050037.1 mechanosensitive ion channel family protein [Nitrososphaerota archaeon]
MTEKQASSIMETSKAITKTVIYVILYVVSSALLQYIFTGLLPSLRIYIAEYAVYAQILLALAFGYLIVNGVASIFYWSMRTRYDHSTAAAIRNVVKIIGVGALVASIAGGVAGGAAGVALGGFLGMVVGFASQQVLGQAIAGLFLLIARPFKIGDHVVAAGEEGIVNDVATLFTRIVKSDGNEVLIPNTSIIGGKIYLKPKQTQASSHKPST